MDARQREDRWDEWQAQFGSEAADALAELTRQRDAAILWGYFQSPRDSNGCIAAISAVTGLSVLDIHKIINRDNA